MSLQNVEHTLFSFPDEADYKRFGDLLRSADFTEAGIGKALGIDNLQSLAGVDMALLRHRTRAGSDLDVLIRLFLLGIPVDTRTADRSFGQMLLETLFDAELILLQGESVASALSIRPCQGLLFAFDWPERLESPDGTDYVMGIGRSSLSLANLIVRNHSRLTLDLGTGCGFLALMAAGHSDNVIAVDRNPRALSLTSFNAKINGLSNIECRAGSFFEPVQDCKFDLIVSNPPFVVSPETEYMFRDSGMAGDAVCRKIAREAPPFLSEGGWFQMLCNWVEYPGKDWRERIAGWFNGTGCDVWVLYTQRFDPASYASMWIQNTVKDSARQRVKHFDEWLKYYDQLGIEALGGGVINVRRSNADQPWFQADKVPEEKEDAHIDAVVLRFELQDFLQTVSDDKALLGVRVHASPDLALRSVSVPAEGGWSHADLQLMLSRGLKFAVNVDSIMTDFVAECDGRRSLGELMTAMAASLGIESAGLEPEFCSLVRRLVAMGFLLPPNMVKN